jgi:uncharacterized membrane protein YagU involved in acid resistance
MLLGLAWGLRDAFRGALAGAAAVWLMDLITTALLDAQPPQVTEREAAARPNGKPALVNLVERLEKEYDVELSDEQRDSLIQLIHYGLGAFPGAMYGLLRSRVPLLGAGNGALYGLLVYIVNDEFLNSRLGLAGPFPAYPIETHWRGLVGHLVLGVATDTGIELLGG